MAETVDGDEARRHIDESSRKYTGHDFTAPVGPHGRVILKVTPDKVDARACSGADVGQALSGHGYSRPAIIELRDRFDTGGSTIS